jgi:hypothetical protein
VDLAAALKQLSRETATNLMLDTRVGKEAKTDVSLQMEDVPLETAVRLVSEMAGLKPVKVGNVLFVTTKTLANEMRNDPDLNQPGANVNPGMMPGVPGGPFPPGGVFPGGVPGGIGAPIAPGAAGTAPAGAIPGVEKAIDPDSKPGEEEKKVEKEKSEKGEAKPEPKPDKPEPKPAEIKKDKEG